MHELDCITSWLAILRDVQRMRGFEKRVLRKMCGAKTENLTREWKNCLDMLNDLHSLSLYYYAVCGRMCVSSVRVWCSCLLVICL